jgi:hypothetical protein
MPWISAEPGVVSDSSPCFKQLQTRFFEEPIVNQALSLYNIRQELWSPINQRLRFVSLGVPKRMKSKTAYMVPNPLEFPMQREMTAKILKDVLFEVFLETLRFYQVNERPSADFAFDYIFAKQMPRFVACFGPEAQKLFPEFD